MFDDYGWLSYQAQQHAEDAFMAERGHRILELPTGQGLVIKPGVRKRRPAEPLRIGFTFNVKRVDSKSGKTCTFFLRVRPDGVR